MGEIIGGRFELNQSIGQGGMGTVYLGIDLQSGQSVAVKRLRSDVLANNPGLVERFVREGEALRRLNHPNIVKVLSAVEEDHHHYLVMEYVGGGSLADLLQQHGQLPIERVLEIGLELADALTRAHHLKITHRDIKPANVLLAEDGTPRLTDFGIARLDDQSRMTGSGVIVGTFAYLSPEGCEGREPDTRTDIWSFGVMLYEMLTGRRPFDEDNMAATITAILTKSPPDLSRFRADVPDTLAHLISRMLEKDRDQRISSARQVGAELEAILRGETTSTASQPVYAEHSRFEPTTPDLDSPTTIAPTPVTPVIASQVGRSSRWPLFAGIIGVLGVIILLLISTNLNVQTGAPSLTPTSAVAPIAQGEYIALVADFEPINVTERDVGRFIFDDLKQQLEVVAPFSKLRVRQYPEIIKSDEEARAIAEANNATVIVWGNYTAEKITANVQIGSTAAFKYNPFDRTLLERTANIRVELTDETIQSVAPQVLTVKGVLAVADGDIWGFGETLVTLQTVNTQDTGSMTDTVAVHTHRFFALYLSDSQQAISTLNDALDLDLNNPILFALRSQANWRVYFVDFTTPYLDAGVRDGQTAQELGPSGWAYPFYLKNWLNLEQAVSIYSEAIEQRPQDWFPYFVRGTINYQRKDLTSARADFEAAAALQIERGFPYYNLIMLDFREGRFADALQKADLVRSQLVSNPSLVIRIYSALFTDRSGFGVVFPLLARSILGQYEDVTQTAINFFVLTDSIHGDYGALVGAAYCNLGDYENAHRQYTLSLSSDANNSLLHLLRAETWTNLKRADLAYNDIERIRTSTYGDAYAPFVAALLNGEFGCKDLFNAEKIAQIEEKYGTVTNADIALTLTAVAPTPTPQPSLTPTPVVTPISQGEYMVLVAQFEPIRTDARDVSRFIFDDLKQQFEVEAPFSRLRVRQYPEIIKSDEEARAIAEANNATVIVWGNYTADKITANVQIGSTAAFKYNQFDRALLERTANIRVELTDETIQSVAYEVLGIVTIMNFADGDLYGFARSLTTLDSISGESGQPVGNSIGVQMHRYLQVYKGDFDAAFVIIDSATYKDTNNALLFAFRSQVRNRIVISQNPSFRTLDEVREAFAEADRDATTAQNLGPASWPLPYLLFNAPTPDEIIENISRAIALRPDDWFLYFWRASFYYQKQDFVRTTSDIEQSIKYEPELSYPYAFAALLAWRDGRLADSARYAQENNRHLSTNPDFLIRVYEALFGENNNGPMTLGQYRFSLFNRLTIGQYQDTISAFSLDFYDRIEEVEQADINFMLGIANCNLTQFEPSATMFDVVTTKDMNYALAYLLRAESLFEQNQDDLAWRALRVVEQREQADRLAPFVAALLNSEFGCGDLFNAEKIAQIEGKYGNVTQNDIALTLTAVAPTPTPAP